MIIESLNESEQALMRACSDRAAQGCWKSIRPIYANSLAKVRPKHIGSCILLDIDGTRVLSTAAHIADEMQNEDTQLYVGGLLGSRLVPIAGRVRATVAPDGVRDRDPFDGAFWVVPVAGAEKLGGVEFLGKDRLSHNRAPSERRYFMAYGFARSRNKTRVNHVRKSISIKVSRYTSTVAPIPELARELGVSGNEHFFLQFGARAEAADGTLMNSFGPVGLSGGGLFDLGDFTSPAIYADHARRRAALAGMLIEYHPDRGAIVAVKIGPIVQGIRLALEKDRAEQRGH
jgi:hypothetical protein